MPIRVTLVIFIVLLILATIEAKEHQLVNINVIQDKGTKDSALSTNEEDLKRSNDDRSRSKNPQDEKFNQNTNDIKPGRSARRSSNNASGRADQINNDPATNKYSSWSSEDLKSSLNHRSNSMNPNSKQYNPSSQTKNLKSSSNARQMKKELDSRQRASKSENLSATQYAAIKALVGALLSKCHDKGKWDAECATEVAKEVGVSTLFAAAINNLPLAQALQRLHLVNNACVSTSGEECLVASTKFVTGMAVTMTSYTIGWGVLGPVIDGVAQYYVTDKLLDAVFDSDAGESVKSKANAMYDSVSDNHVLQYIGEGVKAVNELTGDVKDWTMERVESVKNNEEVVKFGNVAKEKFDTVAREAKERLEAKAESLKKRFEELKVNL
ncbi:hypothetical protein AKO1_004150 [Acrasis kona]|uniref:Uncharacterized protein n=1 Tax=Acrasis kona TaxID=1008807 RepID=A0AAW2ZDU1_9EUKA